jgi:cellulose synthase operon protein C
LRMARAIPERLGAVDEQLAREIAGLSRLVAAEALFGLDRAEEAVSELQKLRGDMPGSEAALQSFIVEADIRAADGSLVESQRLLTQFADDYRDHAFAPYAIYQAALNAERRGEDAYYQEAYKLLEGLIKAYPTNVLIFDARRKQGDLLRRLGDFSAAQRIYELLVNDYAQHSERAAVLAVQMALADSHRAQASRDPSHFESAITLLERLRDLADAPLDLRAEAGFKLGDILAQRGSSDALAAWAPVAKALVMDRARAAELGSQGRYWMGRMLVSMASLLEAQGHGEEAGEAWRLIVERGLPGFAMARAKLAGSAVPAP